MGETWATTLGVGRFQRRLQLDDCRHANPVSLVLAVAAASGPAAIGARRGTSNEATPRHPVIVHVFLEDGCIWTQCATPHGAANVQARRHMGQQTLRPGGTWGSKRSGQEGGRAIRAKAVGAVGESRGAQTRRGLCGAVAWHALSATSAALRAAYRRSGRPHDHQRARGARHASKAPPANSHTISRKRQHVSGVSSAARTRILPHPPLRAPGGS